MLVDIFYSKRLVISLETLATVSKTLAAFFYVLKY